MLKEPLDGVPDLGILAADGRLKLCGARQGLEGGRGDIAQSGASTTQLDETERNTFTNKKLGNSQVKKTQM